MFDKVFKKYVEELIDCSFDKYDIKEEEIDEIVDDLINNDYVFQVIDECIYQELDKYKVGEKVGDEE